MSYHRGHVRGPKRERTHSQDWYAPIQEAIIARLEQEEAATLAALLADTTYPEPLYEAERAWQEQRAIEEHNR